jgi:hypothetical protein
MEKKFTKEESQFLRDQYISEEDVFDASDMYREAARQIMKELDLDFMIGSPCRTFAHRLRTRAGHCIQCDTKKIAFQRRYGSPGIVYVAYSPSGELTKVGSTQDLSRRIWILNNLSYGGQSDWHIHYYLEHKQAGRIEQSTHQALRSCQVQKSYIKQGIDQLATEIFACSPETAVCAIQTVVSASQ